MGGGLTQELGLGRVFGTSTIFLTIGTNIGLHGLKLSSFMLLSRAGVRRTFFLFFKMSRIARRRTRAYIDNALHF